jgi:hypothetical protein
LPGRQQGNKARNASKKLFGLAGSTPHPKPENLRHDNENRVDRESFGQKRRGYHLAFCQMNAKMGKLEETPPTVRPFSTGRQAGRISPTVGPRIGA